MSSKIKRTVILLLLVSIGFFATDIYLPSLPALAKDFQVSNAYVKLTLFSYMLSFSFGPLIFGPLSDHIGRRKVVHLGLFLSLLATIGCALSNTIYLFMAFRFLQGVGTGATMIAGRSMVSDFFKGKELATQISYITMSMPLVLAFAPVIGGYLQEAFHWQSVFLFLILYILGICTITLNMEESLESESRRHISSMFNGYKEILSKPLFILFGFGVALPAIGTLAYLTFSPFIFQNVLGLSAAEYGMLSLAIGGSVMFASFLNVRLLKIFSVNTLLWVGSGCMITAGLILLLCHLTGMLNTWTILVTSMLYFFCFPFTASNSVSKSLGQIKHHLGGANAILTTAQIFSGMIGTLVFSFIPATTSLPLALCYLSVGLISALVLSLAIRYEDRGIN